ncbi:outer membrane protein [Falsirhodobacter xinxiangensis]|uniref:outer membrane protein n=1 Tax=Falsirhodobacter xinxiangensis TaxID=2530049 RepID=UPI0010AB38F0|nr:outer membrane beta-barrel protein [Rhodobacter xinxiangensis]
MRSSTGYILVAALAVTAAPALAGGPVAPIGEIEPIAPAAVAPTTPFAGAYVGADIGYAFKGDDVVGINPSGLNDGDLELSGALANLHVGYRWQPGVFVWGVELGVEGGGVDDAVNSSSTELKSAVTLRAMSGWTPNDATLLYGFAGVSHANFDYEVGAIGYDGDVSSTGYVAGFGVERLLNDRWSVRGEYQYSDYGRERLETAAGWTNATPKFHSVRVGVNYRF